MTSFGFGSVWPEKIDQGVARRGVHAGLDGQIDKQGHLFLRAEPDAAGIRVAELRDPEQAEVEAHVAV
mgnify:CR=1 FL=1